MAACLKRLSAGRGKNITDQKIGCLSEYWDDNDTVQNSIEYLKTFKFVDNSQMAVNNSKNGLFSNFDFDKD